MTRTEHLLKLAEATLVLDHNENAGWYEADFIESHGAYYPKNARFIAAANPSTIKQLVELVRLQNTTIGILRLKTDPKYGLPYANEAIEAFNKFEGGE